MLAAFSVPPRSVFRRCLASGFNVHNSSRHYGAQAVRKRETVFQENEPSTSTRPYVELTLVDGSAEPEGVPKEERTRGHPKPKRKKGGSKAKNLPPRPPGLNRLEAYLESLRTSGAEPTIADLQKFRPQYLSLLRQADLTGYKKLYKETAVALGRSFTTPQLLDFVTKLESTSELVSSVVVKRKRLIIERILGKHWKMPAPSEVERKRREATEPKDRSFGVTPAQLFLLLGKDGVEFKEMATRFAVTLFVDSSPLSIRARGLAANLDQLETYLEEVEKTMISEEAPIDLDLPLRSHLSQRISRLAGALVENVEKGKIRITGYNQDQINSAKRLIGRAIMTEATGNRPSLLAHLSDDENGTSTRPAHSPSFGLYPYVPATPLPWTMGASSGFRPRRVGEWLLGHKIGSLQSLDGEGVITTLEGTLSDLRQSLINSATTLQLNNFTLTASPGHVLFTALEPSNKTTLTPPLPGSWRFGQLMAWVREGKGRATFVPSLPPSLAKSAFGDKTELIRLQYRYTPSTDSSKSSVEKPTSSKVVVCEIPIPQLQTGPSDDHKSSAPPAVAVDVKEGEETRVDLILPDRPMDLRLVATRLRDVSADGVPYPLSLYAQILASFLSANDQIAIASPRPIAPPSIMFEGLAYDLESVHDVRKSQTYLKVSQTRTSNTDDWPELSDLRRRKAGEDGAELDITLEATTDLESEDRASICSLKCNEPENEEQWRRFLRQCDDLTLHVYPSVPAGQRAPSLSSVAG